MVRNDPGFSEPVEVKITIIPQNKCMEKDFTNHDNTMKTYATPASDHVFKTREHVIVLEETQANICHSFFSKALFSTKGERPDIHITLTFLSISVRYPDKDARKKLARIMMYLFSTLDILLDLRADRTSIVKWWLNVYHRVNPNCRVHTGETKPIVKLLTISTSTKQKLNTGSSTETELVAADDIIPYAMWKSYFLYHQGYKLN